MTDRDLTRAEVKALLDGMTEAPKIIQRIWMPPMWEVGDGIIPVDAQAEADDVSYILATPEALAEAPEVQALIAEAVEKATRVKPLVFCDESGDGVLTSRETGELFRIFPQSDGTFFAPKLPIAEGSAKKAQTLIDRLNARYSARIKQAIGGGDDRA